jgi:gas vesicle protein
MVMAHHEGRPNVVLISLLAGLAGAGIALLLAPRSGRETRARLQLKADDIKHQAQESYEQLRDQAKDTIHQASDIKDKIASAIKTHKNGAKDDLESTAGETPARRQSSVLTSWDEEV